LSRDYRLVGHYTALGVEGGSENRMLPQMHTRRRNPGKIALNNLPIMLELMI